MITIKNILPVSTVKKNLLEILRNLQNERDPIVITKDGKAAGILMSADEYEGWIETLEIMADKKTMRDLKKSAEDVKKGRVYTMDEVFGRK